MTKKSVSLCMIVKNEEKHLARCLDSIKDLVDEIVIIDTGSSDRTVEIAKQYGAKVDYYKWDDHFSNARNYSIQQATKDWIMLMDADDEFSSEDKEKFIHLINTSDKDGHFFKTISYAGEMPGSNTVTNLNLRLIINNGQYAFAGAIHEQITRPDGKMDYKKFTNENIHVFHYGYLNHVAEEKDKRKRNISIIEKELKEDPYNSFHLFNLGNEYYAMGDLRKCLELFDKVYRNINFNTGFSSKLVIKRIMCLEELREYKKALTAIEEGLSVYPKFTDLEFIRGNILLKNKRYTLAIKSFEKCIKMGSPPVQFEFINGCGQYRPCLALGEIYDVLEDYQSALEYFELALKYQTLVHLIIYKIAAVLNKTCADKTYIAYKLSRYFDLENTNSLLLLSNVLISQNLYDLAYGYIQKSCDLEPDNEKVTYLMAKILFYKQAYKESCKTLSKITNDSSLYGDKLKYEWLISIITGKEDSKEILEKIKQHRNGITYRTYLQLYEVYQDKNKVVLSEEDHAEDVLNIVISVLDDLLKVRAFEIFEKMLNVLNLIDTNKKLLALAKLYYNNKFKPVAVKEMLRSLREFGEIDLFSIQILEKELIKTGQLES